MKKSLFIIFVLTILATIVAQAQQLEVITTETTRSQYQNKSYLVFNSLTLSPGFTFLGSQGSFFAKIHADATMPPTPEPQENFIKTEAVFVSGVTTTDAMKALTLPLKETTYRYLDGIGRNMQAIQVGQSPAGNDLVNIFFYDELGLASKSYRPYVDDDEPSGSLRTDPIFKQGEFYSAPPLNITPDERPFAETTFEKSPLETPLATKPNGLDWSTKGVSSEKFAHRGATIAHWEIVGGVPKSTANWPSTSLVVDRVTNEDGTVSRTYTDFMNRVVAKEKFDASGQSIKTYYVYNDYGNLMFIIPEALSTVLTPTPTQVDLWCYQVRYDDDQHQIGTKSPGAAWIYTLYDQWDRPVLSQDGNQREKSPAEWSFVKYDDLNRAIIRGIYKSNTQLENLLYDVMHSTGRFEQRTSNSVGYTLNQSFPTSVLEQDLLTIEYYDDYAYTNYPGWDAQGKSFTFSPEAGFTGTPFYSLKGLVTGGKTRNLKTTAWLNSVQYYDTRYRPLQIITENVFEKTDRLTTEYNFADYILKTSFTHTSAANQSTVIRQRYDYDNIGRQKRVWFQVNSLPEVTLNELEYNELSQLTSRSIHRANGATTWLQKIDYLYNERGWLSKINYQTPTPGEPVDYFHQELAYQFPLGTGNQVQYNGKISALRWNDGGEDRAYNYTYDKFDQLDLATYKENGISPWSERVNRYNEDVEYDINGNITLISRNGVTEPDLTAGIDNLGYTYTGNQIFKVDDTAPPLTKGLGFTDGNSTGNDYSYDANGNLTSDKNKMITTISYNHLNMPKVVNFQNNSAAEYIYDAGGKKLSETIFGTTGQVELKTEFCGPIIYENGVLKRIETAEGFYVPATDSYAYTLNDHLGTPRVILVTNPNQHQAVATLETTNNPSEQGEFLYYDEAVKINSSLFNYTPGANTTYYSARLAGTSTEKYGLAKSLSVMPGDKITLRVFAKYLDTNTSNWTPALASFMQSIAMGTAAPNTVIDGGFIGSTGGTTPAYASLLNDEKSAETGNAPKAYLNFLVFDRNFALLDGGYIRVSEEAKENGNDVDHQELFKEITIQQAGYVYAYLSNENETPIEVYFDDFQFLLTEGPVAQINALYPYGMLAYSYVREDADFTNQLFQGKEYSEKTGWHDFHARQYDGQLGRFLSSDAAGQFSSPYNGMGNNPVSCIDPTGNVVIVPILIGAAMGAYGGYQFGKAMGATGSMLFFYTGFGAVLGALSGGVGSQVTGLVGATVPGQFGGLIGSAVGAGIAGGISNFAFSFLADGNTSQGFWKGALSGMVGGAIGGYVAGWKGAVLGGAAGAATSTLLNGGSSRDVLRSAAVGGALSYTSYWATMYATWKGSSKEITWKKYWKRSYMAQKVFGRGREWGAWETADDVFFDPQMGTRSSTTPPEMITGAAVRIHYHPNWGSGWQETFSDYVQGSDGKSGGDIFSIKANAVYARMSDPVNQTYLNLDHYVIGRQNTYWISTFAATLDVTPPIQPSISSYNAYYRYPFYSYPGGGYKKR